MQLISKILVLVFLFLGESLYLYSEMYVAKNSLLHPGKVSYFILGTAIVLLGGIIFLGATYFGIKLFKNIWILATISVMAILIMSPMLALLFFKQTPTIGAAIGFALGIIGLLIAIFF